MQVSSISISQIDDTHDRWHLRQHLPAGALIRLQEHLDANGMREPVVVRAHPAERGVYQLVSGRLRLEAARRLGWESVDAKEVKADDAAAATIALTEELQEREPQTYLERGWAVARTVTIRGDAGQPTTVRALARDCRTSVGTLHNALRIGKAFPPSLVERLAGNLEVSLDRVVTLPQGTLLRIARGPESQHVGLLRQVMRAHVDGDDPGAVLSKALNALRCSSSDRGAGQKAREVRLSWPAGDVSALTVDPPLDDLAVEERLRLALALRATAVRLESGRSTRSTRSTVERCARWIRGGLTRAERAGLAFRRLLSHALAWIRTRMG